MQVAADTSTSAGTARRSPHGDSDITRHESSTNRMACAAHVTASPQQLQHTSARLLDGTNAYGSPSRRTSTRRWGARGLQLPPSGCQRHGARATPRTSPWHGQAVVRSQTSAEYKDLGAPQGCDASDSCDASDMKEKTPDRRDDSILQPWTSPVSLDVQDVTLPLSLLAATLALGTTIIERCGDHAELDHTRSSRL